METVHLRTPPQIGKEVFRRLFVIADLKKPDGSAKRCHPHLFWDTFAVEVLYAVVPLIKFRFFSVTPA